MRVAFSCIQTIVEILDSRVTVVMLFQRAEWKRKK